jgi:2-desacetyl-2-hydroxyethyl bacteriochlorophyllide A dehydrogenase
MRRQLLVTGPRQTELGLYEEEELGELEVRAAALVSGISHGTELSLWRGSSPFASQRFDPALRLFVPDETTTNEPFRLGYEWVGEVVETGSEVASFAPGDRIHLALPHRETHTFVPDSMLGVPVELPTVLPVDRATLIQTTTIALQTIHDAALKLGDGVAIFGLGTFGLLAVQLARLSGAVFVAAADPLESRRRLAESYGADVTFDPTAEDVALALRRLTGNTGVDVAVEFSGRYAALQDALRSVRVAGTVVAAGFYAEQNPAALLLGQEFHHNRLTLIASMGGWSSPSREPRWSRPRARELAARLLAEERLRTDELFTQRFPFDQAQAAYELIEAQPETALRVVLDYR